MRCFLFLMLAAALGTAAATDLERIDQAIGDGRAAEVIVDLLRAADSGEPRAQRMLAALYQRGDGVARSVERAAELYRLAADQGDAEAQFNLGNMYLLGEGVQPDEAWAMTFYRRAASQGHELALRNLNQLLRAAGVAQPMSAPEAPLDAAANPQLRTEPNVVKRLGVAVDALAPTTRLDGELTRPAGTPTAPAPTPAELARRAADEQEALRLAAEHGIEISLDDADGDTTPSSPMRRAVPGGVDQGSGEQVAPAAEPRPAAPARGVSGAAVPTTDGKARMAQEGATLSTEAAAQFELAQRYLTGEGVEPDEAMAITLLRAAARQGHVKARERLAQIYAEAGLPVPPIENVGEPGAPNTGVQPAPPPVDPVGDLQPTARATQAPLAKPAVETSSAASPTNAGESTFDDARQALDDGDLERAAQMFTLLAERGDAAAQAHIGYMTYRGEGVAQDSTAAADWYRKAAEQGNADAQYNLAVAYANGEGVARDLAAALAWYQRAAEQGSVFAQYSLGVAHARGVGTAQDANVAARWYLEAARQGHPAAQYSLAQMYRSGTGVDADPDEALRWYRRAAAQGHPAARTELAALETNP